MTRRNFLLCLLLLASLAPLQVNAVPKNDQAFGDWKAFCGKNEEGVEACYVFQSLLLKQKDKQVPLLYVAAGYPPKQDKLILRFRVPLGVLLPAGITFRVDERKAAQYGYSYCDKSGCWANMTLGDDELWALKAGNKAFVTFTDLHNKGFAIPVSLKGFTAAVNSLK